MIARLIQSRTITKYKVDFNKLDLLKFM